MTAAAVVLVPDEVPVDVPSLGGGLVPQLLLELLDRAAAGDLDTGEVVAEVVEPCSRSASRILVAR